MIEDFSQKSLGLLVNYRVKIESQGRIFNGVVSSIDEHYIYLIGKQSNKIRISIDEIDAIHFPAKVLKVDY